MPTLPQRNPSPRTQSTQRLEARTAAPRLATRPPPRPAPPKRSRGAISVLASASPSSTAISAHNPVCSPAKYAAPSAEISAASRCSTGCPKWSATNCIRNVFRLGPPSTKSRPSATGDCPLMVSNTSAICSAIASRPRRRRHGPAPCRTSARRSAPAPSAPNAAHRARPLPVRCCTPPTPQPSPPTPSAHRRFLRGPAGRRPTETTTR